MSDIIGFARAVRIYGDRWRTAGYNELELNSAPRPLQDAMLMATGRITDEEREDQLMQSFVQGWSGRSLYSGKKP